MAKFFVFDIPPLFTLTRAIPEPISLSKIFGHWPADQLTVLIDAQSVREALVTHCKTESSPVPPRLDSLNRYLSLAAEIECIRTRSPRRQPRRRRSDAA
jgi:hypothetical protein